MAPSSTRDPPRTTVHVRAWLADYAANRLENPVLCEIEAHLLACDPCFAALLAQELGLLSD